MDRNLERKLGQLETVLQQQIDAHDAMVTAMQRKRSALRAAKAGVVADSTLEENRCLQAISELEKQRLTLAADLTLLLDPAAKQPMKLDAIADRLDDPDRTRLLLLRLKLRKAMERVQHEAKVIKLATDTVLRNLTSMVQSISAAATQTTTYSRGGGRPRQPTGVSTFSMVA